MEENKEKIYLEITPDAEKLIGKISKIGNELTEYFGTESMFEPNRTKESLYFLFAINEESSNLDVMFELDINLCYNREILANEVIHETYQNSLVSKLEEFYNVLYNIDIQKTKTETMSKKEFFKKFYKKYKKHTGVNNVKKEIKYSYVW
ncbi:MAG TPA: hypothetical protein PK993_06115 [Clostridia bacterium]|nr:hypothetical protein [Clostridia bacterium]